jgi:hypothetical protein
MQNLPQAYLVGLVKKVSKKSKRTFYQLLFSSKVQSKGKLRYSYGQLNYTAETQQVPLCKGTFTCWDQKNQPAGREHKHFVQALKDHGVVFSDFVQSTNKGKNGKQVPVLYLQKPVKSPMFIFGAPKLAEDGKPVPNYYQMNIDQGDEQPLPELTSLTVSKLRELAADYSISIPASLKVKSDIISFLEDQLA